MNLEDKTLLGMLRLSLHHNSQVLELATHFMGTMEPGNKRRYDRLGENFKKIHEKYNEEHKLLMENFAIQSRAEQESTIKPVPPSPSPSTKERTV